MKAIPPAKIVGAVSGIPCADRSFASMCSGTSHSVDAAHPVALPEMTQGVFVEENSVVVVVRVEAWWLSSSAAGRSVDAWRRSRTVCCW